MYAVLLLASLRCLSCLHATLGGIEFHCLRRRLVRILAQHEARLGPNRLQQMLHSIIRRPPKCPPVIPSQGTAASHQISFAQSTEKSCSPPRHADRYESRCAPQDFRDALHVLQRSRDGIRILDQASGSETLCDSLREVGPGDDAVLCEVESRLVSGRGGAGEDQFEDGEVERGDV